MSKVIITLKPGQPREIKVVGVPGESCHQASKPYANALGGAVISDTPTDEAKAAVTAGEQQQVTQ